jgi:hypothetical protein
MTIELLDLELEEVSLVTAGDDPLAKVAIFKTIEPQEENMTKEQIKELQDSIDVMKLENEKLRKALIDNDFVITADEVTKKAKEEEIEVGGEMVAKSAIPAVVLKALEASLIEKEEVIALEKGKEAFPHFDPKVAKEVFRVFSSNEEVMKALTAADAVFKGKTEELGKADTDNSGMDASAKLNKMANDYKAEKGDKKMSYQKAYAEVSKTDAGKALIKEIYKKD